MPDSCRQWSSPGSRTSRAPKPSPKQPQLRAEINARTAARQITSLQRAGCTLRGLAADLACSESSLRWYQEIAQLPEAEQAAIASGQSAELFVMAARRARASARQQERIDRERATGELSDRFADLAIHWLEEQAPCLSYLQLIVREADCRLWMASQSRTTTSVPHRRADPGKVISLCRPRTPKPTYGPELIEWLTAWFSRWLLAAVPELPIRNAVLARVRRQVQA